MSKFVTCVDCKYHKREKGLNDHMWYSQYCTAVSREKVRDPVTGKMMYGGVNGLGQTYTTDEQHMHCRDINTDGKCSHYQRRGVVAPVLKLMTPGHDDTRREG